MRSQRSKQRCRQIEIIISKCMRLFTDSTCSGHARHSKEWIGVTDDPHKRIPVCSCSSVQTEVVLRYIQKSF